MRIDWMDIRDFILQPKLWLFLGICFILYSFIFEKSGFIRQYQLVRENKQLHSQVLVAKQKLQFLQHEVEALQNDVDRMKQEAVRNGYAEKDEVIIHLR
jgi:cell division protein FtsB